jgi:hypothetical protein
VTIRFHAIGGNKIVVVFDICMLRAQEKTTAKTGCGSHVLMVSSSLSPDFDTNMERTMPQTTNAKSFTVRLAPELYDASAELARKRCVSLNSLIQECLSTAIRVEEEHEMYDAAELLGQDPDECDVEYAFAAQSEVALRDEA